MITGDQINEYKEKALEFLFRVDIYPDVFERIALYPSSFGFLAPRLRLRIPSELFSSPFLFIHVPKNAGTSIKRALYACDVGHTSTRFYCMAAPDLLQRALTFSVVRDPIERFMSSFDFLMNRGGEDVLVWDKPLRRLRKIRTIDDFITYLEGLAADWLMIDNPGRPQWWYLVDVDGKIRIRHLWILGDKTGGLEDLIVQHTGRRLDTVNRTKRFTFSLNARQVERLERIYRFDFALYRLLRDSAGNSSVAYERSIAEIGDAVMASG